LPDGEVEMWGMIYNRDERNECPLVIDWYEFAKSKHFKPGDKLIFSRCGSDDLICITIEDMAKITWK
jgi:hypothetical protein